MTVIVLPAQPDKPNKKCCQRVVPPSGFLITRSTVGVEASAFVITVLAAEQLAPWKSDRRVSGRPPEAEPVGAVMVTVDGLPEAFTAPPETEAEPVGAVSVTVAGEPDAFAAVEKNEAS